MSDFKRRWLKIGGGVAAGSNFALQAFTSTGTEYAEFDDVSVKELSDTSWQSVGTPDLQTGILDLSGENIVGQFIKYRLDFDSTTDEEFTAEITNITLNYENSITANPGTLWWTPKGNYTGSLWMLDFSDTESNGTAYDSSACGPDPSGTPEERKTNKKGSYALNYNSEKGQMGRSEKSRMAIYDFPKRLYQNTFRIFFSVNGTTNENQLTQVDINVTQIINRTDATLIPDTTTYRLYRISRFGGIYNDTGFCFEQPVLVGE